MHIRRKAALLSAALLLLLAVHLRLDCQVSCNGQPLEGSYSPFAVDRAVRSAFRAAEELLPGSALMPEIRRSYRLRLGAPPGDETALASALLRAVPGVALEEVVFINGERLGVVEDGGELFLRLQNFIDRQQPCAAVAGSLSGQLRVRRLYSRADPVTNYDDMLLLITGMAPILYVDENGKLV